MVLIPVITEDLGKFIILQSGLMNSIQACHFILKHGLSLTRKDWNQSSQKSELFIFPIFFFIVRCFWIKM